MANARSWLSLCDRADRFRLWTWALANGVRQYVSEWRDNQLPEDSPDQSKRPNKPATHAERVTKWILAGQALREQTWDPMAPYLDGCKTVLISPDGALTSFPWGALPGKEPAHFLLEDVAISLIPIPKMLPEMLAPRGNEAMPSGQPSLLIVGNVDLYGDPGRPEKHDTPQIPKLSDKVLDKFGSLPMSKAQGSGDSRSFSARQCSGHFHLTDRQPSDGANDPRFSATFDIRSLCHSLDIICRRNGRKIFPCEDQR